jgi:tetraacyldisaccharide 4'-kinase
MDRYFLDVISGRRGGVVAAALRGGAALCEPVYGLAVHLRNQRYARGAARVVRAGVPVVSVGNITTGGTGKTPVVAWIVERLRALGRRPGILSRGYRSLDGLENDEKRLLELLCPGVPHVQGADRVVGASRAVKEHGCDVLVLDDGFQHRRLARDLDIVLVDALNPWGYGRLLPRGLLREPAASLKRAQLVIITRADLAAGEAITALRQEICRLTNAETLEGVFAAEHLTSNSGERLELALARGRRAAAFCGIGNPAGFAATLAASGLEVAADAFRAFADHHHYNSAEAEALGRWARGLKAELLLTTRKDLVKLPGTEIAGIPLWGVEITFRPRPEDRLLQKLLELPGFRVP